MKKPFYKVGDVVSTEFETRVIFQINSGFYYYLTMSHSCLFYNPTHGAVGTHYMDSKYVKVGEVKDIEKMIYIVADVAQKFNKAFKYAEKELQEIKVILLKK